MGEIMLLKNISKTYDQKVKAVKNVTLSIEAGKSYSITGPSGCGKSTLLNIIGQTTLANEGEVKIPKFEHFKKAKNVRALQRNAYFGYIAQNYLLIDEYSVYENVEIPLLYAQEKRSKKEKQQLIHKVLKKVGLENKIHENVKKLSGGQQQRVAIARALVNDPTILLADEPTGALDRTRGKEIMSLLLSLVTEGKTLILVTHDQELASQCDRQIQMIDGEILALPF